MFLKTLNKENDLSLLEEVKKLQTDVVPMKGDERILRNSAFVNQILSEAEKYFERRHYLKTVYPRFKLSVTAVSKSVVKGKQLVKQSNLLLVEEKKVKS